MRVARGSLRIDLVVPLGELSSEVFVVDKTSLLEERPLHPPDEILDRPFLLGTSWPAQLDADSEIERDGAEDRIPLGDLPILAPLERDRLRAIEHREQRQASPRGEVVDHRSNESFDALILDEADLHPARVLETRGKEVHTPFRSIDVSNIDAPEVVLRELAGESLEADDGFSALGPQNFDQLVQRGLAAAVALATSATKKLESHHVRLLHELAHEELPERPCLRRATDAAL